MTRPMRIGIRLAGINTLDVQQPGNVQGDELIARGWAKVLEARDDVEYVRLYGKVQTVDVPLDVMINYNPLIDLTPGVKNVLYLQNAFSPRGYENGTVGVFRAVMHDYDGYIFTSEGLMRACAPGAVVPFATDPERFSFQPDVRFKVKTSFCGNNIRGQEINERYLYPALPYRLALFGNGWQNELPHQYLGKLPMENLANLYSSSMINLNAHIDDHLTHQTINLRIYDILACGGFVLSDQMDAIADEFGDTVAMTSGYADMAVQIEQFLADPMERMRRAEEGQRIVLDRHCMEHRAEPIMRYLKEVV